MYRRQYLSTRILILLLLTGGMTAYGQISPGELTQAHAHLEGMMSCTKCHTLGDKVSNDKCLDCHKEIKTRIDQRKGYHASADVRGKDCFACHSDHHGRKFDIIRFDEEKFDHNLTGYKLTGAHTKQECIACHKDERIESAELRKKETTYLGLRTDCIACHKDVHQNTLSTDCAACHTTEAFKPATGFDHAKTGFPLKGQHTEVDCRACHMVTFTNGALFQRFTGMKFNSCADCHDDVHDGQFGTNCKECHTEESFSQFIGKSTFNHNQTQFPLVGKHRRLDCAECHKIGNQADASSVFQDFKGKDFRNCVTCHNDVHETRLGTDCKKCHTEESFQTLLNRDQFNHSLTGYTLEGKHGTVDCRKCHESKMTDPLPHDRCIDCHDDKHNGQFIVNALQTDCRDCHSMEGFSGSLYTLERHNEGRFPLTGAHVATPCFACHLKNEEWTFRQMGERCIDCHTDVHEGFLSDEYYPQKSCDGCHVPQAWTEVRFDHEKTGFDLAGKHHTISCTACHKPEEPTTPGAKVMFTGLQQDCISCHDNVHDKQFEQEGVTDCKRCHGFDAFIPSVFDHNTARFVLTGAHVDVACAECHKPDLVDGREVVKYRLEHFECADCHSD